MTMPFLTSHSTSTLPEYLRNREVFQKLYDTQLFARFSSRVQDQRQKKNRGFSFFLTFFTLHKYCSNLFTISIQEFCIKVNNFLKLYQLNTLPTDRKLALQDIFITTKIISAEGSKKANSDVTRTPKIWHRNDKNHKHSHFRIVQSTKMPCIL